MARLDLSELYRDLLSRSEIAANCCLCRVGDGGGKAPPHGKVEKEGGKFSEALVRTKQT